MAKTKKNEVPIEEANPAENDVSGAENLGVFVGLVAVAKGRYEVVVLNTKGSEVTTFDVPFKAGDGQGSELHVALKDMAVAIHRYVRRDPASLWRDNPSILPETVRS